MSRRGVARLAPTAVLALCALAAPAAARPGLAVEGIERTRLIAPAGVNVDEYRNAGYRLRRVGDEIHIEVDASPLGSRARFDPPAPGGGGSVARLAQALAAGAETRYQAISQILGWVARNLDYELDRGEPQTAEAVLERRSGYCTGVARLTVALLEAAGIAAREVAGYVVDAGDPGQPSGYHRWIEAHLPDRGWVMSDPLLTHHYVPATYLRLASETIEPTRGIEGLLLERQGEVTVVDLYPSAPPGITARRNVQRQLAAALRVRLDTGRAATAVLTGGAMRRSHALVDGATTFVGLDPGRYRLRVLVAGKGMVERTVELPDRERRTLFLRSPAAGRSGPAS